MADFWIIDYKERFHEDEPDKLDIKKHPRCIAVDVDSVVTIEHCDTIIKDAPTVDYFDGEKYQTEWFLIEVDNGWTYKAQVLSKVDDDQVLDTLVKAP